MGENIENTPLKASRIEAFKEGFIEGDLKSNLDPESERSKTSLRMVYEAQAQVIQSQIGDLEHIRLSLGLSARKICQLLMVDPSAWNRWTKSGGKAPPHVWRSLQWYLSLQDKLPGLTPQYFIERVVARGESKALVQVEELNESLHSKLAEQTDMLKRQEKQILMLKNGLFALTFGLLVLAGFLVYAFRA